MTSPKWLTQLPAESQGGFPDCEDDVAEIHDHHIVGAAYVAASPAERPELVNTVLERCDIAGFVGQRGRAERVLLTGSRLRGVTWANGLVRDVQLVDTIAVETSFRFSELRHVAFRDCKLTGIDFTKVSFDDVRFENCELVGATFNAARIAGPVRIEGCDLTGCSGAEALRGASIHADDLMTFSVSMARALGLTVE